MEKSGQSAIELLGNVLVSIKNKKLADVKNGRVCFGLEVWELCDKTQDLGNRTSVIFKRKTGNFVKTVEKVIENYFK